MAPATPMRILFLVLICILLLLRCSIAAPGSRINKRLTAMDQQIAPSFTSQSGKILGTSTLGFDSALAIPTSLPPVHKDGNENQKVISDTVYQSNKENKEEKRKLIDGLRKYMQQHGDDNVKNSDFDNLNAFLFGLHTSKHVSTPSSTNSNPPVQPSDLIKETQLYNIIQTLKSIYKSALSLHDSRMDSLASQIKQGMQSIDEGILEPYGDDTMQLVGRWVKEYGEEMEMWGEFLSSAGELVERLGGEIKGWDV